MSEPTATASVFVTAATAAMLELSGAQPAWLFAAFFGSLLLQAFSTVTVSKRRALLQVVSSSVLGAFAGAACADYLGVGGSATRGLLCGLGGFGAYPIMAALVALVQRKINGSGS